MFSDICPLKNETVRYGINETLRYLNGSLNGTLLL